MSYQQVSFPMTLNVLEGKFRKIVSKFFGIVSERLDRSSILFHENYRFVFITFENRSLFAKL